MNDAPEILGEVFAWREGEQWYYATKVVAPYYAEPATVTELDGQVMLSILRHDHGQNVRGAEQVT